MSSFDALSCHGGTLKSVNGCVGGQHSVPDHDLRQRSDPEIFHFGRRSGRQIEEVPNGHTINCLARHLVPIHLKVPLV